jgi:hypothetical protein
MAQPKINPPFQQGRVELKSANTMAGTGGGSIISTLPTTVGQGSDREIGKDIGKNPAGNDRVPLSANTRRRARVRLVIKLGGQDNSAKSGGGNNTMDIDYASDTTPYAPLCVGKPNVGIAITAVNSVRQLRQQADD